VDPRHIFADNTYQTISRSREKWATSGWDVSLYQLLYDFRHLDCKRPEDRIYGFLGLALVTKDMGMRQTIPCGPTRSINGLQGPSWRNPPILTS